MSVLPLLARRLFSQPSNYARAHISRTAPICTSSAQSVSTMDDVNRMFAEARLSLQDALESKGTTYFEDDFQDAKQAVDDTLKAFDALLDSASAEKKTSLVAANRPKMAQLKQEFENLHHELVHDD